MVPAAGEQESADRAPRQALATAARKAPAGSRRAMARLAYASTAILGLLWL